MKLKDFNLVCPHVVLDEVFLINPYYRGGNIDMSTSEIAERCGLTEKQVIERLKLIESHCGEVFKDRNSQLEALLLNFEVDATPHDNIVAVHLYEFVEILKMIENSTCVICLSHERDRAFSAAIALKLKGYAHVSADQL